MMEKHRRKLIGEVISDKMDKTCVVAIDEKRRHPIYQKSYHVTSKIKAHDEKNEYHLKDKVEIESTRPISKSKSWKVTRKIS